MVPVRQWVWGLPGQQDRRHKGIPRKQQADLLSPHPPLWGDSWLSWETVSLSPPTPSAGKRGGTPQLKAWGERTTQ